MNTMDLHRRLSDARMMLSPLLRTRFQVYYTDLDAARFISLDGTLALQWRPGKTAEGIVEVLTLPTQEHAWDSEHLQRKQT